MKLYKLKWSGKVARVLPNKFPKKFGFENEEERDMLQAVLETVSGSHGLSLKLELSEEEQDVLH